MVDSQSQWRDDQPNLEFFAASIAALAGNQTEPKIILASVIEGFAVNPEQFLDDKARSMGYADRASFEADLLYTIEQQLHALHSCRLTSAQRGQRRLIASL